MKLRWSREGKIVWSRPEIVVMITLGREKLMQHMLLGVHEVTEQCVVVVRDELSCRWPVSRVETGPDSTTDDSFDTMCCIICRREASPGTGRVEQCGENDGSVYSLQCLVVHAVAAQHVDDMQ